MMMCNDDATTTKRWAPFSPPDEFDVVDAALPISWVLATIWARGRAPGGRVEGVVGTLLIVELGSPVTGVFWKTRWLCCRTP